MENASKALIIAGAILISILLISVGVLVMNAMNPMTEQAQGQSEGMAIKTFNAQFTGYEGNNRTAAQIRALKADVEASNATNPDTYKVTLSGADSVINGKRYTVTLQYGNTGANKGYVSTITVTAEGGSTTGNTTGT